MGNIREDDGQGKSAQGAEFFFINRNFGNYPIARDARARMDWQRGKRCWKCAPEEADFWIMFPLDGKAERRCPSAFDVQLLLMLLCKADMEKTSVVEFSSIKQLLRELQVRDYYRSRLQLKAGLELWCEITLVFDRWYDPKSGRREKRLPPPLHIDNGELSIRINEDWRELSKIGFRVKVPTTLPLRAAAQNMALNMLSVKAGKVDGWNRTQRYSRRGLSRKFGIHHRRRNQVLSDAVDDVQRWLRRVGGQGQFETDARSITFVFMRPRFVKKAKPKPVVKKKPTPKMVYAYGSWVPATLVD